MGYEASLASLCEQVIAGVSVDDAAFEVQRMQTLVIGAIHRVAQGDASYDDAAALIAQHVSLLGHRSDDGGRSPDEDPAPTAA
jgi:hypothetical protein